MRSDQLTSKNIFKFVFFLTFIDLLLFSIVRLQLKLGLSDVNYHPYFISDFSLTNYFVLILYCFGAFILTISLTSIAPKDIFKIHISRSTFFLLSMILLISSIYIFFVQQTFRPRYGSGSIMTLAGISRVFNSALLLCLFIIYQLNRKQINYKYFIIILASSILVIDGVGGGAMFLSLIIFEFFRMDLKNKISSSIFIVLTTVLVLDFSFSLKYNFGNKNTDVYGLFSSGYTEYSDYMYSYILPRISIHAEQLYSYISNNLDISNYDYLSTVVIESFNNRIKVIFYDGENLFYPKTIAQSIAYNMEGMDSRGGSSPGYVLGLTSFLPFTLPLLVMLTFFFKQFSSRLYEKVNFIQVACFCWLIKIITANLLDMLPLISTNLMTLVLAFLSSHIFIIHKDTKKI